MLSEPSHVMRRVPPRRKSQVRFACLPARERQFQCICITLGARGREKIARGARTRRSRGKINNSSPSDAAHVVIHELCGTYVLAEKVMVNVLISGTV